MKSKKTNSRRQTLSHQELQSFLCEIGNEGLNIDPNKEKIIIGNNENLGPNQINCILNASPRNQKLNNILLSPKFSGNIVTKSPKNKIDSIFTKPFSDEDVIRQYCRVIEILPLSLNFTS